MSDDLKAITEDLINAVADVNTDENVKVFLDTINRTHRTYQASLIRFLKRFIEEYQNTGHDLRNQEAVRWAKATAEAGKDITIPYI